MGTSLSIRFDDREALRLLGGAEKEVPYTLMRALNLTAEDFNRAGRAIYPTEFHARNPQLARWLFPPYLGAAQKATKTNLRVILDTGLSAAILDPFETGKPHGPSLRNAGRLPAVPSDDLRITPMTVIPRQLYPVNLGLQVRRDPKGGTFYYALGKKSIAKHLTPLHTTSGGRTQLKGRFRTFQIDGPKGPMILQRETGGDVRVLWFLKPSVPRPASLRFVQLGRRIATERWPINLNNSALFALLHPKP